MVINLYALKALELFHPDLYEKLSRLLFLCAQWIGFDDYDDLLFFLSYSNKDEYELSILLDRLNNISAYMFEASNPWFSSIFPRKLDGRVYTLPTHWLKELGSHTYIWEK